MAATRRKVTAVAADVTQVQGVGVAWATITHAGRWNYLAPGTRKASCLGSKKFLSHEPGWPGQPYREYRGHPLCAYSLPWRPFGADKNEAFGTPASPKYSRSLSVAI